MATPCIPAGRGSVVRSAGSSPSHFSSQVSHRKEWKPLRGKYRKILEPTRADVIEGWYNTTASHSDRNAFRLLIGEMADFNKGLNQTLADGSLGRGGSKAVAGWKMQTARAGGVKGINQLTVSGFQVYVNKWFALDSRKRVMCWLNCADQDQLRGFLHVIMCLEQAANIKEHKTRTLPEPTLPFPPQPIVHFIKKKPERRHLDGREPFARLPIHYNTVSATTEHYQPLPPDKLACFSCNPEDGDLNRIACNPQHTSVMRIIPAHTLDGKREPIYQEEVVETEKQMAAVEVEIGDRKHATEMNSVKVKGLQSKLGNYEGTGKPIEKMKAVPRAFTMKFIS